MNYQLLVSASLPIQIHIIFAISAFLLGAFQLIKNKGTSAHKIIGRIWVAMMLIISITSFWIKELMPRGIFFGYSPIHLLSIFTIVQTILGAYFARKGKITSHKRCMTYTYFAGLIVAGVFAFYPSRLLYRVFLEQFIL